MMPCRADVFRRIHLSALALGLALFVPFVFVGQYAKEHGVGSVQAAVLVGVLGGASVVSRIGFGTLVRRHGSFRLYKASFVIHLSSFLIWFVAAVVVRAAGRVRARARRRLRRLRGARADRRLGPDGDRRAGLDPGCALHRPRAGRPDRSAGGRLVDRRHRHLPLGDRRLPGRARRPRSCCWTGCR